MRTLIAFVLATMLGACTPTVTAPLCPHATMTETRLYFGLSQPSGRLVTERQFADFVAAEVTPRIPEGFTIQDGHGFWKDGQTTRTISEASKVLVHLHQATPGSSALMDAIADAYKQRFRQESVLRTDAPACVEFR